MMHNSISNDGVNMTEKLYYQDVFLKEFSATVQSVRERNGKIEIVLDQTAFYPEGGGQLADSGWLKLSDGSMIGVFEVQEEDGEIWHTISMQEQIQEGTEITGIINWDLRFDHMQQHSGEHIVSGMICSAFDCNNVGFHMGEDIVTIDYDTRISFEQILEIEAKANEYIWEDHEFVELWPSEEELKQMEYRSKKELEGDVRITSFPGADSCACCGTHVASSGQVGMVKFLSAKNFREGTRLELLCGKRAFDYLSMNYTENKAVAVKLSTSEQNTSEYVGKLLEEHLKERTAAQIAEEELLKKWAANFPKGEKIFVIEDWMSPKQARQLADLAADQCQMVAVFAKNGDGYQYSVIARNTDISAFIKEMNQVLNGRGGGRDGFAQGSVNVRRKQIAAYLSEQGFRNMSEAE